MLMDLVPRGSVYHIMMMTMGRFFVLYCTISHMKCALFLLFLFLYITSKRL